jgi:hypothetical protein
MARLRRLLTHSGHCSGPLNLNQLISFSYKYLVPESLGLSLLRFSATVAVLPPIAVPHVIAFQSDALPDSKCRLSEWLVSTR